MFPCPCVHGLEPCPSITLWPPDLQTSGKIFRVYCSIERFELVLNMGSGASSNRGWSKSLFSWLCFIAGVQLPWGYHSKQLSWAIWGWKAMSGACTHLMLFFFCPQPLSQTEGQPVCSTLLFHGWFLLHKHFYRGWGREQRFTEQQMCQCPYTLPLQSYRNAPKSERHGQTSYSIVTLLLMN